MRAAHLQDSLERLTAAIRDVESELAAMKAEQDPLASHIFVSRRYYRNVNDTKSGKRREMIARQSRPSLFLNWEFAQEFQDRLKAGRAFLKGRNKITKQFP